MFLTRAICETQRMPYIFFQSRSAVENEILHNNGKHKTDVSGAFLIRVRVFLASPFQA